MASIASATSCCLAGSRSSVSSPPQAETARAAAASTTEANLIGRRYPLPPLSRPTLTALAGQAARDRRLGGADVLDAARGKREQLVERRTRQRRALRRGLDFHEAAVARHHDVRVHLCGGVLRVVEV